MFSNLEKLTAVLVAWIKPLFDTVLAAKLANAQPVQAANEWIKKYFSVAANYSIVNDLSFLAAPATEMVVEPVVRNAVEKLNLQDKYIPAYAAKIVDAALDKVAKDGSITLFNTVELEDADLRNLRHLLAVNLPVEEYAKYEVIQ